MRFHLAMDVFGRNAAAETTGPEAAAAVSGPVSFRRGPPGTSFAGSSFPNPGASRM